MDDAFQGNCAKMVAWRRFLLRFCKGHRGKNTDRLVEGWRRRFFGLPAVGERRSERIRK